MLTFKETEVVSLRKSGRKQQLLPMRRMKTVVIIKVVYSDI
jgi:hypothetical protein